MNRFWSDDDTEMHIDDASTNPKGKKVVLEHFGFRAQGSAPHQWSRVRLRPRSQRAPTAMARPPVLGMGRL